jgi:hypothetical protein
LRNVCTPRRSCPNPPIPGEGYRESERGKSEERGLRQGGGRRSEVEVEVGWGNGKIALGYREGEFPLPVVMGLGCLQLVVAALLLHAGRGGHEIV